MDLTQLLAACITGLATGAATVAGTSLAEKTRNLFSAFSVLSEGASSDPTSYGEEDAVALAEQMSGAASGNAAFKAMLDDWQKEASAQLSGRSGSRQGVNVVKGLFFKGTTITQNNG